MRGGAGRGLGILSPGGAPAALCSLALPTSCPPACRGCTASGVFPEGRPRCRPHRCCSVESLPDKPGVPGIPGESLAGGLLAWPLLSRGARLLVWPRPFPGPQDPPGRGAPSWVPPRPGCPVITGPMSWASSGPWKASPALHLRAGVVWLADAPATPLESVTQGTRAMSTDIDTAWEVPSWASSEPLWEGSVLGAGTGPCRQRGRDPPALLQGGELGHQMSGPRRSI